MTFRSNRDPALARLLLLAAVLFVSYFLCVAIPLPIVPVYVTATSARRRLGGAGGRRRVYRHHPDPCARRRPCRIAEAPRRRSGAALPFFFFFFFFFFFKNTKNHEDVQRALSYAAGALSRCFFFGRIADAAAGRGLSDPDRRPSASRFFFFFFFFFLKKKKKKKRGREPGDHRRHRLGGQLRRPRALGRVLAFVGAAMYGALALAVRSFGSLYPWW